MKKIAILTLIPFFFCLNSFSASSEAIIAALKTAQTSLNDIMEIKEIERYRCPNCFLFLISGSNASGHGYVKVRTIATGSNFHQIHAEIVEQSR